MVPIPSKVEEALTIIQLKPPEQDRVSHSDSLALSLDFENQGYELLLVLIREALSLCPCRGAREHRMLQFYQNIEQRFQGGIWDNFLKFYFTYL